MLTVKLKDGNAQTASTLYDLKNGRDFDRE
jgi:hypothetical protein